ncbi:MAG: HesA/MoeB/ThiF family protein [Niabella sp.]
MDNQVLHTRYQRQIALRGFGEEAQQKLSEARVLVVAAGGLGCPVLQYLCAAGVGTIGVVDDDVVSLSNLHRQVLYKTEDVGKPKAIIAAEYLRLLNPQVTINVYNERLTVANALDILKQYDIIIDGSDNFATRYLVNDACVLLNKPLVYGAILQYEGRLSVFNIANNKGLRAVNYRDIFARMPATDVPDCSNAGVLGVLPGVIGTMMATEVIKLITGIGDVLQGAMMIYNLLSQQMYKVYISPDPEAEKYIPETEEEFKRNTYKDVCAATDLEIGREAFNQWLGKEDVMLVDVRAFGEEPVITEFEYIQIPFNEIENNVHRLIKDNIVLFCASGKRSLAAARQLKQIDSAINIYSLKGGIVNWKRSV